MKNEEVLELIAEIVPFRVLAAIANGLIVGLKKHREWDSSEPASVYHAHRQNHLAAIQRGEVYDKKDGHTHESAVIIRSMQSLDKQLQAREVQCPADLQSTQTR